LYISWASRFGTARSDFTAETGACTAQVMRHTLLLDTCVVLHIIIIIIALVFQFYKERNTEVQFLVS
jgi:hypothetical protein